MHFFSRDLFVAGLLLLTGVASLPTTDLDPTTHSLSKRAFKWDKNCDTKYGARTAKQWLGKSWDMLEPIAKAGHDSLEQMVKLFEFKAGITTADPNISEDDQKRLVPLYEVLFGKVQQDEQAKTLDKADVERHVVRVTKIIQSLDRLVKIGRKPNLAMHCDDDFLRDTDLQGKPHDGPADNGKVWRFNTDLGTKGEWEHIKLPAKVCVGQNAGVTWPKKTGQKNPETMVICPAYFKIQDELEKLKQPHVWELKPRDLPKHYYNMKEEKEDDYHMAAFGRKLSMKIIHEMMHTTMFYPERNYFKDQLLKNKEKAYTFVGAATLASEDIELAAKNIDNVVYWSFGAYFDGYHWETGYARVPEKEKEPVKEGEAGKKVEKRVPKGKGGGGGGGGKPPPKTNNPPPPPKTTQAPPPPPPTSQAPPPPPSSTQTPPPPPSSTQAPSPPSSSQAPPSSSLQPSSSAAPSSPSSSAPSSSIPSSSNISPSSSASLSSSTPLTSASTTNTATITTLSTQTTSTPCTGTLCTHSTTSRCTGTGSLCPSSSSLSSSSSAAGPAITLDPEPISVDDVRIAAASKVEASVVAWEAAGAGLLGLWGLSEVLPTDGGAGGDGTASAGLPIATAGPENGTFSADVRRSVGGVAEVEVEKVEGWTKRGVWRYIF